VIEFDRGGAKTHVLLHPEFLGNSAGEFEREGEKLLTTLEIPSFNRAHCGLS
jgi:hypothetical protein